VTTEFNERRVEYLERILDNMYDVLWEGTFAELPPRRQLEKVRIVLTAYEHYNEQGGEQLDLDDIPDPAQPEPDYYDDDEDEYD
jgi:hypothetical protein